MKILAVILLCAGCDSVVCHWSEPLGTCNTCVCEAPGEFTDKATVNCDYAAKTCRCTTMMCPTH